MNKSPSILLKRKRSESPVKSTGRKYIGAHVSAAGGVSKAITNAIDIGAKSCALFLSSQRQWTTKPLSEAEIIAFKSSRLKQNLQYVLPHGSYLVNMANPQLEMREKSFKAFLDDVKRCQSLGISLYNFHPGSALKGGDVDKAIVYVSDYINQALDATQDVTLVIENMAGQGFVLGSNFQQLKTMIDNVKDKSRIGICLDTCHLFAAGYDISTAKSFAKVLKEFDEIVGLSYLKAMHLNDSKGGLECHADRHENIGKGKIGIEAFEFIMNNDAFNDMPLVLETPIGKDNDTSVWKQEIELLNSLIK